MNIDDAINERHKACTGRYPWELSAPHARHHAREDRKLNSLTNRPSREPSSDVISRMLRSNPTYQGLRNASLAQHFTYGIAMYGDPTWRRLAGIADQRERAENLRRFTKMMNFGSPGGMRDDMRGRVFARRRRGPFHATSPYRITLEAIGAKWSPHVPEELVSAVVIDQGCVRTVVVRGFGPPGYGHPVTQQRVMRWRSRLQLVGLVAVDGIVHARNVANSAKLVLDSACSRVVRPRGEFRLGRTPGEITCQECFVKIECALLARETKIERERNNSTGVSVGHG